MKMVRFAKALISSLVMIVCVAAIPADDEEDVYFILSGEADEAIASGDYLTAIERIKEAMAVDPANPSNVLLLSNLGMVYNCLDEDSLALAALNEAHLRAPAMLIVIKNRGILNLKMGNNRDAFEDFTTVIETDSLDLDCRYYHGLMALYAGDQTIAEKDFAVLRSNAPDDYNTLVAMASLYSLTGSDSEAIPYYLKLIEEDPSPEFYSALAGCYLATEQLSEASSIIADGLRLWPEDPELYYYRAWLNRDRYRNREAHEDAKRAVSLGLDPKRADALFAK